MSVIKLRVGAKGSGIGEVMNWEKIVYELNKMRILFLFLENVNMQARVNAKF